jgi:ATP-dependent RNA helicase RhlE
MKSFADLGLAETIVRAVAAEGYTHPTPIQAGVIPAMIQGQDVLGIAQTGTGKTAAFVLPLLHKLGADNPNRMAPRMPKSCRALILAPTRELAGQIVASIQTYGKFARLTTALVVGGARALPQIKALAPGVDILVATPGRLLDHLQAKHVRLDQAHAIVLDEADQMMDLGFLPAIKDLLSRLPKERQTLLLSATMPKEIRGLADQFLRNPLEVKVAAESKPIERIEQKLVMVDSGKKPEALIDLLADQAITQAIVFTRTKHGADRVEKLVRSYGHYSMAIHGNKSQGQRDKALLAFRQGKVKILVATDVAARGIDVDNVSHVFNYDLPNVPEAYVHRIGRTGRAGRSGIAVSLCDSTEIGLAIQIERLTGCKLIPDELRNQQRRGTGKPGARPASRAGGKPQGRYQGKPAAGGKPFGAKPFGDRPTGPRPERSFEPRTATGEGSAEVKPFAKPFAKPGSKPFAKPAHAGASGAPARDGKPFGKREDRPAGKAFGKSFAKPGAKPGQSGSGHKPRPAGAASGSGAGGKTFGGKPSFNRGDVKRAA